MITGATSGIGLELAKSFSSKGANIIMLGKDEDKLDEPYAYCQLAESIDENTVTVELTIKCDDSKALNFSRISNYGPKSIPEGKLFVMGDNRFNSQDSRYWGFVDVKDVVGKGQMIYWSHHPRQSLFGGYRFGRIFTFLK